MDRKTATQRYSKSKQEQSQNQANREREALAEQNKESMLRSSKEEIKEFIELEKQLKDTKLGSVGGGLLTKSQGDFFKSNVGRRAGESAKKGIAANGKESSKGKEQTPIQTKWEKKFLSKTREVVVSMKNPSSSAGQATSQAVNSLYNTNISLQNSISKRNLAKETQNPQMTTQKKTISVKNHIVNPLQNEIFKTQPDNRLSPCNILIEGINTHTNLMTPRRKGSDKTLDIHGGLDLKLLEEYKSTLEEICIKQIDTV